MYAGVVRSVQSESRDTRRPQTTLHTAAYPQPRTVLQGPTTTASVPLCLSLSLSVCLSVCLCLSSVHSTIIYARPAVTACDVYAVCEASFVLWHQNDRALHLGDEVKKNHVKGDMQ